MWFTHSGAGRMQQVRRINELFDDAIGASKPFETARLALISLVP
jgi:hypothetical protein